MAKLRLGQGGGATPDRRHIVYIAPREFNSSELVHPLKEHLAPLSGGYVGSKNGFHSLERSSGNGHLISGHQPSLKATLIPFLDSISNILD